MHVDDLNKYEGPPCEMCRIGQFVGTCTHRPRKMKIDEIENLLNRTDLQVDIAPDGLVTTSTKTEERVNAEIARDIEMVKRMATVCQSCHRPLPGIKAPAFCSGCELPALQTEVVELRFLLAALLMEHGGSIAIDEKAISHLNPMTMIQIWRDEATRTLRAQLLKAKR